MKTVVVNKAGRKFADLTDRLEALAGVAAPLVEAVTEMALPDTVVITTKKVGKWQSDGIRRDRQQIKADIEELNPTPFSRRCATLACHQAYRSARTTWRMVGAQTVMVQGRPEIVVLPRALAEAGRLTDESVLLKVVAHELTHVAQCHRDSGEGFRMLGCRFPQERGIAELDYGFLHEGHAYWADAQITTKILGAPVVTAEISPHATRRYLDLARSAARASSVRYFDRARDSAALVIDAHGLDAFNEVWGRRDLVPLRAEASTADAWSRRLQSEFA
ncbi:hypothetical protein [Streptomyces microflavus]|uniref:hypothetical protein n=1 Tax=Streptomyces microflavus TaxID=1919 RepID=UPI0033BD817A